MERDKIDRKGLKELSVTLSVTAESMTRDRGETRRIAWCMGMCIRLASPGVRSRRCTQTHRLISSCESSCETSANHKLTVGAEWGEEIKNTEETAKRTGR